MTPYFNNTPFVTGMVSGNGQKSADNTAFFLMGGILIVGSIIGLYYYQQKHFNKIILHLKAENEFLKKKQNI